MKKRKQFDVGLSFSGEDREFVEALKTTLAEFGVKSFYDRDYGPSLAGEELTEYLPTVYGQNSDLFVPIISKNYLKSHWARHEKRAALQTAMKREGFVVPIRLDDTEIPGISLGLNWLDASKGHRELADIVATKLLLNRLMPSDDCHDAVRVQRYLGLEPLALTAEAEACSNALGQAHLELNCSIALHKLFCAWYAQGSANGEGYDQVPRAAARQIIRDAGFDGPSYSLQIAFVDENMRFIAHPELPDGYALNQTYLPRPVRSRVKITCQTAIV